MGSIAPSVTRGGRTFLIVWSTALVLVFIGLGVPTVVMVNRYRVESNVRHNARIDRFAVEPGRTPPEDTLPAEAKPRQVTVGIYLEGIAAISILESSWSPVMYVWFKWKGDDMHPGETFRLVDGEISSKEKLDEVVHNGEHYALYLVKAQLTKYFDDSRFPADDHLLTIAIEDGKLPWSELEYVADMTGTNISSRAKMPGYRIYKTGMVVKPHTYKSGFGDPRRATESRRTCSQLIYGIWNRRPGLGTWFKVFIGLYAAIAISMLAFFIKPTDVDPRFGLGVGGFFGAVANTLVAAAMVPDSGLFALMDVVNGLGMITIFLSIVQSTISLYLYDIRGEVALSRLYDRISFVILGLGYVTVNILIVVYALV